MRIRNHFLVYFSLPIAVLIVALTGLFSLMARHAAEADMDAELRRAALMAKELLPPGYHDRITGPSSVSAAEYAAIADRFSRLCAEVDLGGIWSVMLLDGRIVFTSASTGGESGRGGPPGFLDAAPEPRLPAGVLATMRPGIQVSAGTDGGIRAALVPFRDTRGRPWLIGASRRVDKIEAYVHRTLVTIGTMGVLSLLLVTVLGVLLARSISRPVEQLTRAAAAIARGEVGDTTAARGPLEIRLLGGSIDTMSASIRGRVEDLASSRQQLARVLEGSNDGFWDWNVVTGDVHFSDRWATMLGYSPGEIVPHVSSWESITHPDDAPAAMQALRDHFDGRTEFYENEHRLKTKDGGWKWILDRGKVIARSPDGTPLTASGTHTDISERKAAEAALQASEARFRSIFDTMTEGVALHELILDSAGEPVDYVLLDVNPAFERAIGISRSNAVGVPASKLYGTGAPPYLEDYSRVAFTGEPLSFESWFEPMKKHFRISVTSPAPGRFITIFDDITWRIKQEEERHALELRVQQSQKRESLGILAGGIAHDFSNLLVAIMGNADLALAELSPSSPARETIHEIEEASLRAAELCRLMLAYSGKGRLVVAPQDLSAVVRNMARELEAAVSRTATLVFRLSPAVPNVPADVSQLQQVIMNLVTNASEAMGDTRGTITVSTGMRHCDRDFLAGASVDEVLDEGMYATLEVADDGCGMDDATRGRLFDPFFTTKFAGRGLGLAAVLGIVRGHKGVITVSSEPDRGSTFRVLLPAIAAESPPPRPESQAAASPNPPSVAQRSPAVAPGPRQGVILLVDDEDTVLLMVKRMLERLGYAAETASGGREAVALFRGNPERFACVILDMTMPKYDGGTAFEDLKRIKDDVKVILSSGSGSQDVLKSFAGRGLAGFIQKPYGAAALAEVLRRVLEEEGGSARDPG